MRVTYYRFPKSSNIYFTHSTYALFFFFTITWDIYGTRDNTYIGYQKKKKKSSPKHYCNARICKRTSLRREVRLLMSTWVHPLSIYLKPCWMDRHLRIWSSAILDWGHLFCLQPSFLWPLKRPKTCEPTRSQYGSSSGQDFKNAGSS